MIANTVNFLNLLALRAGEEILKIYAEPFEVENKVDGSPVTKADAAAEEIILAGLAEKFPDIPVVAEEAVEAGKLPAAGARYFLVDPLDGTKEFLKKNGEFTVNIALIEDGRPVFGVVSAPASERSIGAGNSGTTAKPKPGPSREPSRTVASAMLRPSPFARLRWMVSACSPAALIFRRKPLP